MLHYYKKQKQSISGQFVEFELQGRQLFIDNNTAWRQDITKILACYLRPDKLQFWFNCSYSCSSISQMMEASLTAADVSPIWAFCYDVRAAVHVCWASLGAALCWQFPAPEQRANSTGPSSMTLGLIRLLCAPLLHNVWARWSGFVLLLRKEFDKI